MQQPGLHSAHGTRFAERTLSEDLSAALDRLVGGGDLSREAMREVMRAIMGGNATEAQIGGLLVALRMKGETVDEIAAAAEVMRELALRVEVSPEHLIDTCGTGGDGARTFNVSTAAAFVAAAAGGRVAKHGNRSVSSRSGSADVLEALGVAIDLSPAQIARCIDELGVGFMFAPSHHRATRFALGPRRELGIRTLFNVLGPLTNPARAPNQLIGVYDRKLLEPLAKVLGLLGSLHVLVVHGDDGLDEITLSGSTQVAELKDSVVTRYEVIPEEYGLGRSTLEAIRVADARESMVMVSKALAGEPGPPLDIVLFNAGAAIYAAGLAPSLGDGVEQARRAVMSGAAQARLSALVDLSRRLSEAGHD